MTLDEYQAKAFATAQIDWDEPSKRHVPAFGSIGELGSLVSELKKSLRDGAAYTDGNQNLVEEFGDVLWYLAAIASHYDLKISDLVNSAKATKSARSGAFERGQTLVHEHLVDHDLKHQRRDETEQLQHERGDKHFAQQRAVLHQRRDEPGHVELSAVASNTRARGQKNDAAGPHLFEFGELHLPRAFFKRMLDEDGLIARLAQNEERAILRSGDRRQRNPRQLAWLRINLARLDLQLLGKPQQVLSCRRGATFADLMLQLPRIDRDLQERKIRTKQASPVSAAKFPSELF